MVEPPSDNQIGLGCSGLGNEFGDIDENQAITVVHGALDLGITYFDTSPYYGRTLSEVRLGKALHGKRDTVFLATKAGRHDDDARTGFDFSYQGIIESCESSLRRLRTDHVDLLQLHDVEFASRSQIINEAIPALDHLITNGKARFGGVTGYPLPVLEDLVTTHDFDYVLSYCHYNLANRLLEQILRPVAKETDTAIINASVLHMGVLTDHGPPSWHPAGEEIITAAREAAKYCAEMGTSLSDLSLRYALSADWVSATLIGTTKLPHLQHAIAAKSHAPDPELLAGVTEMLQPVLNTTWSSGRWPQQWHENE